MAEINPKPINPSSAYITPEVESHDLLMSSEEKLTQENASYQIRVNGHDSNSLTIGF